MSILTDPVRHPYTPNDSSVAFCHGFPGSISAGPVVRPQGRRAAVDGHEFVEHPDDALAVPSQDDHVAARNAP